MRVGRSPNVTKEAPAKLMKIVLHVITNLPNEEGYHTQRFEVVQKCLMSMTQGIKYPYMLIVSDNHSIPKLQEWIKAEIKPDIFIDSENYGKSAARKMVASMVPPECVLCYSDDDMYFEDNWFASQLDLLTAFPNVASVSGYPVRTSFRWGNKHTKEWAEKNATLTKGRFIPFEYERDFAISIGRDVNEQIQNTKSDLDYLIEYKGRKAYATSHHCQHIGYAGLLAKALQFDGLAMGSEREFDERLDSMGLRLATTERLTRHMGNVIDDALRRDIENINNLQYAEEVL